MTASTSPVPTKPALINSMRAVAGVLTILVLAQAVIAGQSENLGYGDWSIVPHGILGNISFLFGVAGLVLAIVARAPRSVTAVAAILAVLLTAQIALGYSAGETRSAGAWHIILGVLIFALTVDQVHMVSRMAKDTSEV